MLTLRTVAGVTILCFVGIVSADSTSKIQISGTVADVEGQPVAHATVRAKATRHSTLTDLLGRFQLTGLPDADPLRITAWAPGFYVSGTDAHPGDTALHLILRPYPVTDDPGYEWTPPAVVRSPADEVRMKRKLDSAYALSFREAFLPLTERLELGCQDCHGKTIVDQWRDNAHALGSSNERFMSLYNGTDLDGRRSRETLYVRHPDYGRLPTKAPPDESRFGPGYRLDFEVAGNCASCHLPSAAIDSPYRTDPNRVDGVDAQGSHCDFCHKVVDVVLDPQTGRPFENAPGVLSMKFSRPTHEQVFFGPYDDVDVGPDARLALMQESEFCAPCHDASFWDTPIYTSFPEWKDSDYSERGISCQNCHMAPDGQVRNFAPGRGGVDRDPATIPTHFFQGAADEDLLRSALDVGVEAYYDKSTVNVNVVITNDSTGHHVPTGSPLRHLILVVTAHDADGAPLPQTGGSRLPDWCGQGDPKDGYYAGQAGTAYAKVLAEKWSGRTPTAAYWNPTRIVSDTRLAAHATDSTRYVFDAGGSPSVTVRVRLLFRRAYIELMEQKKWETSDILMFSSEMTVPVVPNSKGVVK